MFSVRTAFYWACLRYVSTGAGAGVLELAPSSVDGLVRLRVRLCRTRWIIRSRNRSCRSSCAALSSNCPLPSGSKPRAYNLRSSVFATLHCLQAKESRYVEGEYGDDAARVWPRAPHRPFVGRAQRAARGKSPLVADLGGAGTNFRSRCGRHAIARLFPRSLTTE
jgi:hypothetical protein